MATGTNWKRPWEDESIISSNQPCNTTLPSNTASLHALGEDYDGPNSKGEGKTPSQMRNPFPSVVSPTPYRHIGLFPGSSDALHGPHHSMSPTYHVDKRQRLESIQTQRHDLRTMPGILRDETEHGLWEKGKLPNFFYLCLDSNADVRMAYMLQV